MVLEGDLYVIDQKNKIVASSDFESIGSVMEDKLFFSVPIISTFTKRPIGTIAVTYSFQNFKTFFSNTDERHYYVLHRDGHIDLRPSIFKQSLKVSSSLQMKPELTIVLEEKKESAYRLLYKYEE
jgi:phosphatidate phosphatase APP1